MAVQHDVATSDPGRPTAIARTNNAVIIAAEGEKGASLTKSLLAKLGHFCLGRATAREEAKSYSSLAAVAFPLLRPSFINMMSALGGGKSSQNLTIGLKIV